MIWYNRWTYLAHSISVTLVREITLLLAAWMDDCSRKVTSKWSERKKRFVDILNAAL
jgi:hypothetical protein